MKFLRKTALPIFLAGMWVGLSEFFRNEVLLKVDWLAHYEMLGVAYPNETVNALVWVLWGFVFAAVIWALAKQFTLWQTALMAWVIGFVMMWLVIWNLSVLPVSILPAAIPLSMLEAFLAAYICKRLS